MSTLVAVALTALLATAGPVLDEASAALRRDPVFVHPDAERTISESEAAELRDRIADSGTPLFIAVLPSAAVAEAGSLDRLPVALGEATNLAGSYAVVTPEGFRVAGPAAALGSAAFQARRDEGTAAVLRELVDRAAESGAGAPTGRVQPEDPGAREEPGGSDAGSRLGLLALLGGGGAAFYVWSRNRRRRVDAERAREEAADRQILQAELSVLADDVMRMEPLVTMHPEARADYDAAVNRYRAAQAALEYADDPVDLVRVERVITEARYAMDRARAIVEGREPPPPPPDLREPGRRGEPPVDVDERGEPAYAGWGGGPFYGGGWFGGGGGLFSGLLLGSLLGGGWGFGGNVYEEHHHYGDDGGGDMGGWGGGDIGGGDWGGGDVGGGDW
jgi:hypothetical protein